MTTPRLWLAVVFILWSQSAVRAHLSSGTSWRQVADDGQHVMVMISSQPVEKDAKYVRNQEERDEVLAIRAKYQQSGMYRNDGSTTPLWTMPFFISRSEPVFVPDGVHLIFGAEDDFAGVFYANGKQLAGFGYSLSQDLVAAPRAKSLLSMRWPSATHCSLDRETMTYRVYTNQGEEFVFDATTGKLIESHSPWRLIFGLLFISLLTIFALPPAWIAWRYRRGTRKTESAR